MSGGEWIVGLDPTGQADGAGEPGELAVRPTSLDGHTVALVSNRKGEATKLLVALARRLEKSDSIAGTILVEKPTLWGPPTDEQWSIIARATLALTGHGG